MNSRERIAGMLRGESVDRVGLCENIWPQTLRQWIGEGYPTNAEGKPADPAEHFGWDMGDAPGAVALTPWIGRMETLQETEDWIIRRNGAGAAHKHWKTRAGVPEHIDFRMTSREAWEADYRAPLLELDRRRINPEALRNGLSRRHGQGKFALSGQMFIWELMRQSWGDICLYESLLADPDWVLDYGRVHTDMCRRHYALLFEEGGRPDGFRMCEDLGYRGGLFCAPQTLRDLIFPFYAEMVEFFHSHGVPVFLHSCGNVTDALDLVVAAGFDGLDPMEVKAGCDTLAFAARYADQLVFRGGLDARVLESGDRGLIERETTRLIEGMKRIGARYIFGSDHSISTNVHYDAYRHALDVYRRVMNY